MSWLFVVYAVVTCIATTAYHVAVARYHRHVRELHRMAEELYAEAEAWLQR